MAISKKAIIQSSLLAPVTAERTIGSSGRSRVFHAKRADQGATKAAMTKDEERELRAELARLLQAHRDLDAAIAALQDSPGSDLLQVQRLKKRKLLLRDRITFIEDQLTPDIIA